MSLRFLTNSLLAMAGATITVFSMAVSASVAGWIAFGTSIGILAVLGLAQPIRGRGWLQRALDVVVGSAAVGMIVTSLIYTGTVLTWLVFGFGALYAGLAFIGLGLYELRTEHIVHELAPVEEHKREYERDYVSLK